MTSILRSVRLCLMPAALAALAGCGTSGAAFKADAATAQETLQAVLDAWKSGAKPESLESRTPPIRVVDLDWQEGYTLVDYKADVQGRLVGYDMNYPVVLELKSPSGNAVKKSAVYTISTHPQVLVLRQEG